MPKQIVVIMKMEDEKKHSIRFKEEAGEHLKLIYVPRETLQELGWKTPQDLQFTIEVAPNNG